MKTVNLNIDKFLGLHSDALGDTELKLGELSDMKNFFITKNYNIEKRSGYLKQLNTATAHAIQGQWYGNLNGVMTHLFASNGHVYKNNGDGTTTDLGTLTDAKTNFFQFVDIQSIENHKSNTASSLSGWFGTSTREKNAQTFTTTRNSIFTSATFKLRRDGSPTDNVVCKLYSVIAGVPTTLLATSSNTVNGTTISPTSNIFLVENFTFYFDAYTLTANTVYALVLERSGSLDGSNFYISLAIESNVYSGGNVTILNGTTWGALTADLWFEVNFKPQYSIYITNGYEYLKYDGTTLSTVAGYIPLIATGTIVGANPTYVTNEQLNSLTGKKRQTFNSGGLVTDDYYIIEDSVDSIDYVEANGVDYYTGVYVYTKDISLGKVEFNSDALPPAGIDNVEIGWTKGTGTRTDIVKNTDSILYGGKNDTRVFLYGDGNQLRFSELADGFLSAEYFPVLNYIACGSKNSNVNALIKQYDRLIIFTDTETLWSSYEYSTTLGTNFPTYPLNDTIGCTVKGSGQLIGNNPFVIFGNKIYEFVASNVRDERNATLVSLRVQPLLDAETITSAITFDNEEQGEYWIILGTECYIYNYTLDVWYYYVFADTITSICKTDKVTLGTSAGQIMKFDGTLTDNGTAIDSYFKTGYINYGTIIYKKFVNFVWVQIYLDGTASKADIYYQTDKDAETLVKSLAFTTETNPKAKWMKPKMKKFVVGKFIVKNNSSTQKCRILSISAPAIIGGISK